MIIEEQPPVGARDFGGDDYVAGAAEFQQHVAGIDEACRQRRGDVIGSAAEYRQSLGQARLARCGRRHFAERAMRDMFGGKGVAAEMRERDEIVADRMRLEIDEPCLERPVLFDAANPGERAS